MIRTTSLLALFVAVVGGATVRAEELVVIVHAERDVSVTVDEVAQIYLKRRRFWGNGEPIVPVNREANSPTRRSFVRTIFGEQAQQLLVYWNRQYFRGVLPPATLASDEAVKHFVASEPHAIGYVRKGAVDASVRVVLEMDSPLEDLVGSTDDD